MSKFDNLHIANAFNDYFASVVVSSDNVTPTIPSYENVSRKLLGGSVVRALDSGPRGREFDSRRLRFRVTRSTQPSIPPG